jgi:hypothetical protein
MGERPLAEESIACVSRVAAAGRCCSDETKREYTGRLRKTISIRKKFGRGNGPKTALPGESKKLCLRRTRADIIITMFECANPYAILGLTSNVLRDM